MLVTTAVDFYSTYRPHIEHDFQHVKPDEEGLESKTSVSASWLAGHPKKWDSELARIEFSESVQCVSLSEDGRLLAVAVGPNIHLYTVDVDWEGATTNSSGNIGSESGTLEPRIQLKLSRIFRSGHGDGTVGFVGLPGGRTMVSVSSGTHTEGLRTKQTVRSWDIDAEEDSSLVEQEHIVAAAEAASRTASQILAQTSASWSEKAFSSQNIAEGFAKVLRVAQGIDSEVLEGHFSSFGSWPFKNRDDSSILGLVSAPRPDIYVSVVLITASGFHERFRLVGHTGSIMWAEFSPNGRLIGTSSWDRTVRIWNAENGEPIRTLTGATNQSWGAAFSPDSKLIAAGSGDRKVRLWNVESGELLHTFEGYQRWIRSLAFSPDGQMLAAGASGGTLRVFDISSGECLQYWHVIDSSEDDSGQRRAVGGSFLEVQNVHYTVDGVLIFKTGDGRVFTFDADTGQKGQFEHGENVVGCPSSRNCVTSHNGRLLFTTDFDNSVRIWRLR